MRAAWLFALSVALTPFLVTAASFPDVPASYAHREAIEQLVDRGVISGNPDGTFRPFDPVDRASMIKLLYKAAGLTVDGSKKNCFSDVLSGSWYEGFVCDAVARGYVQGYDNGKSFKPGKPVTRAEAIKLVIVVLGIRAADPGVIQMYTDVTAADWFHGNVRTALAHKILPVANQSGLYFRPHALLERGEAAAYIWNTLKAKTEQQQTETPVGSVGSSSSASLSSVSNSERDAELQRQREDEQEGLTEDLANTARVSFPFTDTRTFKDKHPLAYRFTVDTTLTANIVATIDTGIVKCRLYRLENDAISAEYYLGLVDEKSCYLRSTITKGQYQLEVEPSKANAQVTIDAKATTGDGNDGMSQSKPLQIGKVRTEVLDANDLEDWYTFKVTHSTSSTEIPGQQLTVKLTSVSKIECLLFPQSDVDLFGFKGPICNESYLYPPGTYMVNIRHALPRAERQTYSVEVK